MSLLSTEKSTQAEALSRPIVSEQSGLHC